MAKYDDKRTRNDLNYNKDRGENLYSQTKAGLDATGSTFGMGYNDAVQSDTGMRNAAQTGYQNFIDTGGLSPMDQARIRSRAVSPIRAAYSNAERNVERGMNSGVSGTMNPALSGLLRARMAREQGQLASDTTSNAEAGIASLISQNKLAGLGGMSQLYGTTPGATSLFSGNILKNQQQQLDLNDQENKRMQGLLNTQLGLTQAPGNTDKAMQWAGEASQIGKRIFDPGYNG